MVKREFLCFGVAFLKLNVGKLSKQYTCVLILGGVKGNKAIIILEAWANVRPHPEDEVCENVPFCQL